MPQSYCSCEEPSYGTIFLTPPRTYPYHTLTHTHNTHNTHARAGSNNTIEAISLTKHAKEVGADACLIVNPYYNKPTQEGLYQHFKKIGEECDQPIVLYVGVEA